MRLKFYDKDFNIMGIIEQGSKPNSQYSFNFKGFEWEQKFYDKDTFALNIPVIDEDVAHYNIVMDKRILYIVRGDNMKIGYIQKRHFNLENANIEISGISIEGLLEKRMTREQEFTPNTGLNGSVGVVMCNLINENRPYEWLVADPIKNDIGIQIVAFTNLDGNVFKSIKGIAEAYEIGFTTIFDDSTKKVYFKAIEPFEPERIQLLSDELTNIENIEYGSDTTKYYNYLRVVGDEDITVIIDESEGQERFEISLKNSTRKRDMTTEEYQELLRNWGKIELAKRKGDNFYNLIPIDSVNIELGEKVAGRSRYLDFVNVQPCTSIKETWEDTYQRDITIGDKIEALDMLALQIGG